MNKKLKVHGMHCKSCEILLENRLNNIQGVNVKKINHISGILEISMKNENNLGEVKNIINNLGYSLESNKNQKNSIFDYIIMFLLFIIIAILLYLLSGIDIFTGFIMFEEMTLVIIFLIGIAASLSSCLAITGGIVIGFANYIDMSKGVLNHIKIQSIFHVGRILGFMLLGGILGSIGGALGANFSMYKGLLFFAGIILIYMGLYMLKIVPSLSKLGISMPKFITKKIIRTQNPLLAPIVGALTFFIPCGFTQAVQIYAASTGSFVSGALIMGIFALGTMPVLFLVGLGSSYFKEKQFDIVQKIIAVTVIYFGIFTLTGFANLVHLNPTSTSIPVEKGENLEFEELLITHNGWTLNEKPIRLSKEKNYKLTILPEKNGIGCMTNLTIPGIDSTTYLVRKDTPIVITIAGMPAGRYNIVCATMGMRQGEIIIE